MRFVGEKLQYKSVKAEAEKGQSFDLIPPSEQETKE